VDDLVADPVALVTLTGLSADPLHGDLFETMRQVSPRSNTPVHELAAQIVAKATE
jgi:hypothetical protein